MGHRGWISKMVQNLIKDFIFNALAEGDESPRSTAVFFFPAIFRVVSDAEDTIRIYSCAASTFTVYHHHFINLFFALTQGC